MGDLDTLLPHALRLARDNEDRMFLLESASTSELLKAASAELATAERWGENVTHGICNAAGHMFEAAVVAHPEPLDLDPLRQRVRNLRSQWNAWKPQSVDELALFRAVESCACIVAIGAADDGDQVLARGAAWADALDADKAFTQMSIENFRVPTAWATLAVGRADLVVRWVDRWPRTGSDITDSKSAIAALANTLLEANCAGSATAKARLDDQFRRWVQIAPGLLAAGKISWPELICASLACGRAVGQSPLAYLCTSAVPEAVAPLNKDVPPSLELSPPWEALGHRRFLGGRISSSGIKVDVLPQRLDRMDVSHWSTQAVAVADRLVAEIVFFESLRRPAVKMLAARMPEVLRSFRKTTPDMSLSRGPFTLRKIVASLGELTDPVAPKTAWIERGLDRLVPQPQWPSGELLHPVRADTFVLAGIAELTAPKLQMYRDRIIAAERSPHDEAASHVDRLIAAYLVGDMTIARQSCVDALRALPTSSTLTIADGVWLAAIGAQRIDGLPEESVFAWMRSVVGLPQWSAEDRHSVHPSLAPSGEDSVIEITGFENRLEAVKALRRLTSKSMTEVAELLSKLPSRLNDEPLKPRELDRWSAELMTAKVSHHVR